MDIRLLRGDLTRFEADAIVNAANSSLLGGGGVDGARSATLHSCYTSSLAVADELGAKIVAFPAVSTGVYGWPMADAARIAIGAVRAADTAVDLVTFVLFGDEAYRAFENALGSPLG